MRCYRTARALVAAALTAVGFHATAAKAQESFGKPVDAAVLDEARGGFETAGGLSLALGIERVVSVNGEVLSRSNIAIPDLSAMTADQARLAHEALGAARMIQLGNGNFAAPDTGLGNGATLVQNTLNDQTIRTATVITSTVNSMSLLKDLNFHSTIRDALVRSAGNL
jgi:hypothetical protein